MNYGILRLIHRQMEFDDAYSIEAYVKDLYYFATENQKTLKVRKLLCCFSSLHSKISV